MVCLYESQVNFDNVVPAGGVAGRKPFLVGLPAFRVFRSEVHGTTPVALVDGVHDLHQLVFALI